MISGGMKDERNVFGGQKLRSSLLLHCVFRYVRDNTQSLKSKSEINWNFSMKK